MQRNVQTLFTTRGVPVYFESLPSIITPVSIRLCMMSGAADDTAIGKPGLHHWFEHVPFRGTVGFPGGAVDIKKPVARLGGSIGAYTNPMCTVYHAYVPMKAWEMGLSRVVDLAARPLLHEEAITAERAIIRTEIAESRSKIERQFHNELWRRLFDGNPCQHPVLGTEDDLDAMDTELLKKAHVLSYGQERCSIFVSGNIDTDTLMSTVEQLLERMQHGTGLTKRRVPARHSPTPQWKGGQRYVVESDFNATVVGVFFPVQLQGGEERALDAYTWLSALCSLGATSSPLARIVREERHLAYHCYPSLVWHPNMRSFGLVATVKRENTEAVISAFHDVLTLPELYSSERWEEVEDALRGQYHMQLIDPGENTGRMLNSILYKRADPLDADVEFNLLIDTPREFVHRALDLCTPDNSQILILQGKGS